MSKNRRGKRGSGKTKRERCANPQQNQALASNVLQYEEYRAWLFSLAANCFIWKGLPPGCNSRYLEQVLCSYGNATVARAQDENVWYSLQAGAGYGLNAYGDPTRWRAIGANGKIQFEVSQDTGFLVWERKTRVNMSAKLDMIARKLAKYERVESVNLSQQFVPWMVSAPEEQQYTVQNILAQAMSGQTVVFGYGDAFNPIKDALTVSQTRTEWLGDKLQKGALGVWGEAFRIMGIPHLQFEKAERMITDEAQTTLAPTKLALQDRLQGRLELVEWLHEHGFESANVKVNPEIERVFEGLAAGEEVRDDAD